MSGVIWISSHRWGRVYAITCRSYDEFTVMVKLPSKMLLSPVSTASGSVSMLHLIVRLLFSTGINVKSSYL